MFDMTIYVGVETYNHQEAHLYVYSVLTTFLLYTLLWADNFKMAANRELCCMLLALKFG